MGKKDSFWFTHDSDAANDPKMVALISVYGWAGYGMFWRFCELLRSENSYKYSIKSKYAYASLADTLKISLDECKKFITSLIEDFELIKTDGSFLWSESLVDRMQGFDKKREELRERGRRGGQAKQAKIVAQVENTLAQVDKNGACAKQKRSIIQYNTIQDSKEENKEEKSPSPKTVFGDMVFKPIETLASDALEDEIYFLQHVCRNNNLSPPEVAKHMADFVSHLKSVSILQKSVSDFRTHFQNWIKKRPPKTPAQPVSHIPKATKESLKKYG